VKRSVKRSSCSSIILASTTEQVVTLSVLQVGARRLPAAFCRKVLTSPEEFEMWGNGKQTRSFTFIDECVEGVLR